MHEKQTDTPLSGYATHYFPRTNNSQQTRTERKIISDFRVWTQKMQKWGPKPFSGPFFARQVRFSAL
jgi:hypothetical protein